MRGRAGESCAPIKTKLRQVLYNLISNASKFTENGTITVDVSKFSQAGSESERDMPEGIKFRVSDTGIGMTEEQMAKTVR